MQALNKTRRRKKQSGIALLLAIFVLLLVCVVGIAMIVASGTEVSLSGNYRSSTAVYYGALSGLEEGRGRLLQKNPNFLSSYHPSLSSTVPLGQVVYIINSVGGETVDPTDATSAYYDNEYPVEFSAAPTFTMTPSTASAPGIPGLIYKWVRINPITEKSQKINVNNSGGFNSTTPIYFDGTNLNLSNHGYQAFGITALAALPDKSQKLLQYVVAPVTLQLENYLKSALTLVSTGAAANGVSYSPPPDATPYPFRVNGTDQCGGPQFFPGIGVLNATDASYVQGVANTLHPGNYTGTPPSPSVVDVTSYLSPAASTLVQSPAELDALVQAISTDADSTLTGPATGFDMPPAMSPANPMTVVVNGDLTLNGFTGYGLLVVTGNFNFSGDSGWKGIILVVGQGNVTESGAAGGGEFDGAFFVAKIRDSGGTLLGSIGPATFSAATPTFDGFRYNSCWVQNAQKPITYKVLSFHEIAQ